MTFKKIVGMTSSQLFLVASLTVTLLIPGNSASTFLGWLLPSWAGGDGVEDGAEQRKHIMTSDLDVPKVPFEVNSVEEKFIDAVQHYAGSISELDACQHRVVLKIQKSCSSLSEEDLAKLSMNLLNCQAAVEGRQQFPCTDKMSLRDCTQSMGADMWNAYHLMNNRARSVCYAARQQQFRASAEMTVDRLAEATRQQLSAMDSLKNEQEKLGRLTEGTVHRQETLFQQQRSLQQFVGNNLHELVREKQLIAAGHREFARMTEEVRQKLNAANAQLESQTVKQRANQEQLLGDLTAIQKQAAEVWAQVERSTREVLVYQRSAARQYRNSLERLRKINETVDYLLTLVQSTRSELDARLGWVTRLAGDSEDGVDRLVCAGEHLLVLLCGALLAAFLGAPSVSRVALVLLVAANIAAVLQRGTKSAIDVPTEVSLVVLVAVVQWIYKAFRSRQQQRNLTLGAHPLRYGSPPTTSNGGLAFNVTPPRAFGNKGTLWSRAKVVITQWVTAVFDAALRILPAQWVPARFRFGPSTPLSLRAASLQRSRNADTHSPHSHNCTDLSDDEVIADDSEDDGLYAKDPLRERTPLTHYSSILDDPRYGSLTESWDAVPSRSSSASTVPLRHRATTFSPPTPSLSSRGDTPSSGSRRMCVAVTRTGQSCRNTASARSPYCYRHADSDGASVVGSR